MNLFLFDNIKKQSLKMNITGSGYDPKKLDRAISRTAQLAESIIVNKTESGKDFTDKAFKAYSREGANEGYYGWRKRLGKSTTPNLFDTGQMLASITSKARDGKATIFFTNADAAKKAAFNQKTRPFFALSRNTKDRLMKFFQKDVK